MIEAGATSVAVISDLLSTGDPAARVREYLAEIAISESSAFPTNSVDVLMPLMPRYHN